MAHLIVGLGNPGSEYAPTRHNIGFRVIDELARRWSSGGERSECSALVAWAQPAAGETLLAKPQLYMNRSGYAVRCLLERHALAPEAVLVVYDEINLPLGRIRLRPAGNPAGHRGMESIIENLRSDAIPRLRLGIGSATAPDELADYVLAPFTGDEQETVAAMIQRAADACAAWREQGPAAAMNLYNG
jgi:PTH1 family peptidyl-tRNA hydrolase